MKYLPSDPDLRKHIDYYWIVTNGEELFNTFTSIHDYPGITPELILLIDGHYTIQYQGKTQRIYQSKLYSFIHQGVVLDMSQLHSFAIVNFKSRALSSLLPFVHRPAPEIMAAPIQELEDVFGSITTRLCEHLKNKSGDAIATELDNWLRPYYRDGRGGFLAEMANELPAQCSPQKLMKLTGYSYSTLERHFKRDTGLTPKKYHSLQRFRLALQDIYSSRSTDWQQYVHAYGYYDQSHFIKEIKRYTTFTPAQLLEKPGLVSIRP